MQEPRNPLQPHQRIPVIFILGALTTVSPFSIDMYLPAFEQMAAALGTMPAKIALSLSSYFLGLAAGQLFWGPLLDRFGRRKPLFAGLSIFVLASVGCMAAPSVEWLIGFRLLQGLGGCAAQVTANTMVRDFFPLRESARIYSLLILILGVSPLLAPTLGGWVTGALGWQAVFAILASIVLATAAAVYFFLPPGEPPDPTVSLKLRPLLSAYAGTLRNPTFRTYAIAGAFGFSGLFVYVASSPLIFMGAFQLSAEAYGMLFAGLSVGFIGGSQVNIRLGKRFSPQQIFRAALAVQVLVAGIFLVGTLLGGYGLPATIALIGAYLACVGISNPNAGALSLAPFERNIGTAAALMGFMQMGFGALASTAVGLVGQGGILPCVILFQASALAGFLWLLYGRRSTVMPQ